MSDKVKKKAVHTVRLLRKPATDKSRAEFEDIKPGTIFMCPKDDVKGLEAAGAIADPKDDTQIEAQAEAEVADPEEERRQELLAQAKAKGVKGVRANSTIETLEAKLAEAEAKDGDGSEVL